MIQSYRKGAITLNTRKEVENIIRRRSGWKIYFPDISKIGFIVIPIFLFILGAGLVASQTLPRLKFFLESKYSYKYAEVISPISDDEEGSISTFESQYFAGLLSQLSAEKTSGSVAGATASYRGDWKGKFSLSIPSAGIKDMPVSANTDSYDETIYNSVLRYSVAHFQGTDMPAPLSYLPDTNTFIYGHSAPGSWSALHSNSFDAAFNPLFDVNVGDEIMITFDGATYTYEISKIKVTKPNDLSMLKGTKGKHTLTLMTCAPPGSTANRLTVVAIQKD